MSEHVKFAGVGPESQDKHGTNKKFSKKPFLHLIAHCDDLSNQYRFVIHVDGIKDITLTTVPKNNTNSNSNTTNNNEQQEEEEHAKLIVKGIKTKDNTKYHREYYLDEEKVEFTAGVQAVWFESRNVIMIRMPKRVEMGDIPITKAVNDSEWSDEYVDDTLATDF